MKAWEISAAVSLYAFLCCAFGALMAWWTPNGWTWRFYCLKSTCFALAFAGWHLGVWIKPHEYQELSAWRLWSYPWLGLGSTFVLLLGIRLWQERSPHREV